VLVEKEKKKKNILPFQAFEKRVVTVREHVLTRRSYGCDFRHVFGGVTLRLVMGSRLASVFVFCCDKLQLTEVVNLINILVFFN
jgi:hypothetical protein